MAPSKLAFSWLLVISCSLSLFLAIVYLFYANRILAFLVGRVLRLSWWTNDSSRAWVSLESLHVSLLAGTIMIKELEYHSSNQALRVIKCRITWRYWAWRTRGKFNERFSEENRGNAKSLTLPCRIQISCEGVEWLLYNRTTSYNHILSQLEQARCNSNTGSGQGSPASNQSLGNAGFSSQGDATSRKDTIADTGKSYIYPPPSSAFPRRTGRLARFREMLRARIATFRPDFHEFLPIGITIHNGAILCGNPSTPTLLVAKFLDADGSYGTGAPRSSYDLYKTVIDTKFHNIKITLERNLKYRGMLAQHGKAVSKRLGSLLQRLSYSAFVQLWDDKMRRETQYRTEDVYARTHVSNSDAYDYAMVETIAEAPALELSYYWDEPGEVPVINQKFAFERLESHDVGNGDLAPQYGIDLVVHGGVARYGPWADRQRVELQRLFFPPTYQDVKPTILLKPGDKRMYTELKVFVELRDTTTFHVPSKEPSKDWQFDEIKFPGSTRKKREGGWLEIRAGGNSTITYIMPWVATASGYDTLAELHLDEVTALSSVNDIRILNAESARVLCELPVPLCWNEVRRWTFNVTFRKPALYLIRDHINLLTDLGKDWSSGPPADFNRWIPMHYVVNFTLRDQELNLFLNDHNIITHPHTRDANSLLTLRSATLHGHVDIPSAVFRPEHTTIPFWVEAPDIDFHLTLPKWNTHAVFATSRTTDFAHIGLLRLDASFLYHSVTRPDLIETLKLEVTCREVVFMPFGWVIRHLMAVRDNYFGNFTHFSTLSEYVTKRSLNHPVGDPVELKWQEGKSNVFEVTLSVRFEDSVAVMPAGFPGYEYSLDQHSNFQEAQVTEPKCLGTCVILNLPELQVHLRTHDYSMEMSFNVSPFAASVVEDAVHSLVYDSYQMSGRQKLHIDGVNIVTNRLFGPQPRTSTYLCLWEIQVGTISGMVSTLELRGLLAALVAFRLNFTDDLNAPAKEYAIPSDPDVTFLKVSFMSMDVSWVADRISIYFSLPQGLSLDYSDLPGKNYKKVTELYIKKGSLRALMCSSLREPWTEAGSICFDVGMNLYTSSAGWREVADNQMKFVAKQDAVTKRAWFLYNDSHGHGGIRAPPAYYFSMFLPRPQFPRQLSPSVPVPTRHMDAGPRELQPGPAIDAARDSDAEDEHISEADRDARLAHSRPETPLLFNNDYDSRSMSSSDESDDCDITSEHSDSDTDGSERDDHLTGENNSLPALSHYRHVLRRFESYLQESRPWNGCLFKLAKDLAPVDESFAQATPRSSHVKLDQQSATPQHGDEASSTIRLFRCNYVDVLLTPLCSHVVRQISEEVFGQGRSMEMLVDSLTTTYLTDVLSDDSENSFANTFDIEVSTLHLRVLQSIAGKGNSLTSIAGELSQSVPPLVSPGNTRMLSDLTIYLHNFGSTFSEISSKTNVRPAFRASVSRFVAVLDTSIMNSHSRMPRSSKATPHGTIVIDGLITAYTPEKYHMKLGDVQVRLLEKESPAMVAATADSLASVIRMSEEFYKDKITQSKMRKQGILWRILQHCKDLRVGDPLTQIQPSFLVQVGRPFHLRLDASWKLFMYLRHCLRHLSPSHREDLYRLSNTQPPSLPVQVDLLYPILAGHLQEWGHELDWDEMSRLPFLMYCFYDLHHHAGVVEKDLPFIVFHSGTFNFAITHHSSATDGALGDTISLGPLHVTYRLRKQRAVVPMQNAPGAAPLQLHPVPESPRTTRHHIITANVENISLTIYPTLIVFLHHLLHLHGRYFRKTSVEHMTASSTMDSPPIRMSPDNHLEIFVRIPTVSLQAAVERMILEVGFDHANFAVNSLQTNTQFRTQHMERQDISGNCLFKFSQIYTRVRQPQDKTDLFRFNDRDVLTSLFFASVALHVTCRIPGENPSTIKGLLTLGSVQLSVPRSALLTYRLFEEWRVQYLPNIYSMTQKLFAELGERQRALSPSRTPKSPKGSTRRVLPPTFDLKISIKQIGILLQVMHGTWFSWNVHDIMVLLRNAPGIGQSPGFAFGIQLASQLIRIGAQTIEDGGSAKTIKLALPSFRSSGTYDGLHLRSHAIIDYFSLTLKPRYMDDILVVQQNIGTHFYDVLDLVAENRKNRPTQKKTPVVKVKYDVAFMLQGFRIGIVGPTTILDLTSGKMTGTAKNESGIAWDFAVSDLALGLSHHSSERRRQSEFDRKLRSAYMVLDLKASSCPTLLVQRTPSSHILRLQVGRMHAVMSPNSVGELGDLIDYIQAEKLLRQEQRAHELEEIKNKTKRVMRTFEVERPTESLKRSKSLLDKRTVLLSIADIGVAFPLALNEIEVDAIGSVPAFLMSIQKATFSLKRHESGQASMGRLSFQFVNQFDQSRPSQFDGDNHHSHNKLLYPGMKAEFQSGTSAAARKWKIGANVDGFVLDLDPSIVDNVFGLIDVYRKGKERVDRLAMVPEISKFTSEDDPVTSLEASYMAVRTSNIILTLVFHTGKVRLRDVPSGPHFSSARSPTHPVPLDSTTWKSPVEEHDDKDADVIYFPSLTVWGEYRATPAASKLPLSQDQEPSLLIFRSQLHSTTNQINPSLFRFLLGFTQRIQDRLGRPESQHLATEWAPSESSESPSRDRREFLTNGVLNGMQLIFSLRIDSSRLELACGHGIGVVAAINWESGGFLVTLSPRSRVAYFAGSVNGLQVDLRHVKHQGGMVQTAHVDARNLVFSVSYSQSEDEEAIPLHSVSVVIDTEFGASLRLDRLQDLLIFKAIYIDRLPGAVPQPSGKSTPSMEEVSRYPIQNFTTLILLRARHIKLVADLGHNVAAAMVNLETLLLRTRITESVTDVALSVAQTSFDLEEERPLAGYMRLPDFSFTTIRRSDLQLGMKDGTSKMLDVAMTSGTLDLVLQSERRTILQYHAKPFDIRIADDWAAIDWNLSPEERTLRLDFSVLGTEVLAIASLQTIPKVIVLLAKLRTDLQAQKMEASKTLATSSITSLPKPNNVLLEVAEAMIRSARSKISDGSSFSYVIVQHMTLRLSNLRFALFKNPNDMEMAMFQGRDVNAELQRVVQGLDMPPSRNLKLAFSALNLSRYSALKYRPVEDDLQAVSWLERLLKGASEAIIARVPAMNLEMNSDVEYEDQQEVLLYDLAASADDHVRTSQGIYVSLNLSLYIWAGALVKGLGAEIEKALITAGFNKPTSRALATTVTSTSPLPATAEDSSSRRSPEPQPAPVAASPGPATTPAPYDSNYRLRRKYHARSETAIDYGTIQQLGEATPDAKAPWLGLKETVPPRVHEYATLPMEVLMKMLLEVYSKQLKLATRKGPNLESQGSILRDEEDITDSG